MTVTIDGSAGITTPGVTDTGNLSVTGTSSLTGAVTQTGSSTAASFIPTGSSVPANGMYLSAANTVNIATNSTNQVAISSTGIVTGTAGNLMLVQGTSQASTSGTSIDFTNIPSWVKRVTVLLQGVSTATATNPPLAFQLGTSGGLASSGYLGASSSISGAASVNSLIAFSTNFQFIQPSSTANIAHGRVVFENITGNTWVATGQIAQSDATRVSWFSGAIVLSGALTQVRITTVSGTDTFDAGTINIQYE